MTLTGSDDLGAVGPVTAVTGLGGAYTFTNLRPGTYTVTETQPAAYNDGQDRLGSQDGTLGNDVLSNIPLTSAIDATGYDFGELGALDLGQGLRGPQRGRVVQRRRRRPRRRHHPAVRRQRQPSGHDHLGGADGGYLFANLPAADYRVVETQPAGYGSSTPNTLAVTLPLAGLTGQDFGETLSSLAGAVYVDRDGSASLTPADLPLGGVAVTLTGVDANGHNVSLATTTALDGTYSFAGLLAGTYTIAEAQPTVWNDGPDQLGTEGGTPGNDVFSAIGLAGGRDGTAYNFGELGTKLSGFAYYDRDRSQLFDAGESGLPGVAVTLRDSAQTSWARRHRRQRLLPLRLPALGQLLRHRVAALRLTARALPT